MSLSTVVEWLNENANRAYPLTSDSTRYLIKGSNTFDLYPIVLDAMFQFSSLIDSVQLTKLQTSAGTLAITVMADITPFTFSIPSYQSASYPQYLRDGNHNLLVIGEAAATLPNNVTYEVKNATFEPCVANEILSATLGLSSLTIGEHAFTGDVVLNDGVQLSFVPDKASIAMEVGRNEGMPLMCGNYSSDTPDCTASLSALNGVTPNKTGNPIYLTGKNHITVYDDPDSNRIYIGFDFTAKDVPVQQLSRQSSLT